MIVTKLKFPSHDSEHIFIYKTVKEALKTIENEINAVYNNDSDKLTIEVTFEEMDEDEVEQLREFEGF